MPDGEYESTEGLCITTVCILLRKNLQSGEVAVNTACNCLRCSNIKI